MTKKEEAIKRRVELIKKIRWGNEGIGLMVGMVEDGLVHAAGEPGKSNSNVQGPLRCFAGDQRAVAAACPTEPKPYNVLSD